MEARKATAVASPNIALIKYWGNRDPLLRLPSNDSVSFNLGELRTTTTVELDPSLAHDEVTIDGRAVGGPAYERVVHHLDRIADSACPAQRSDGHGRPYARVTSTNTFPMGVGIASSASGFAALTLAACAALELKRTEAELSSLARLGSGSACRSIPGGFVAWHDGYATSIAPPHHWNLADAIAIINTEHKTVGSSEGHALAGTSPLQAARVAGAPRRLELCRMAIQQCDFAALAEVIELDALMMHAVTMTSQPSVIYWEPATLTIINVVRELRAVGVPVAFTIDAGPNVHCICEQHALRQVKQALWQVNGVIDVVQSGVGGPACVVAPNNGTPNNSAPVSGASSVGAPRGSA
jgi:diphosphomevalonate decarboxylase